MRLLAPALRAVFGFLQRHRWSVPLAMLSTVFFVQLAGEIRDQDLDPFDEAVASWVVTWRGQLDAPMLALTQLGDWRTMAAVTAATGLFLLVKGRRWEAGFLGVAAGGALIFNSLLKLVFQRARPEGVGYLIDAPTSFSFPSGHAMGSMSVLASCLVLLHVLRVPRSIRFAALAVALVVIPGVALSRVYFGVHFPSDVIGGQLAGAAWVSAITGWFFPLLLPGEHSEAAVEERRVPRDAEPSSER